jgi:hypothetical protein
MSGPRAQPKTAVASAKAAKPRAKTLMAFSIL